jgi:hypothetical protein
MNDKTSLQSECDALVAYLNNQRATDEVCNEYRPGLDSL